MPGPDCRNPDACTGRKPGRNCRQCANWAICRNPDTVAKRAAGLRRHLADPVVRQEWARRIGQSKADWMADPVNMEAERQRGREHAHRVLHSPEVRARNTSPDARARAGRSVSATILAWCPLEYRDQYRQLLRKMPAAEARAFIEDQIKVDLGRFLTTGKLQASKGGRNG